MKRLLVAAIAALTLALAAPGAPTAGAQTTYLYDATGTIYFNSAPGSAANQCAGWDMWSTGDDNTNTIAGWAITAVAQGWPCTGGFTLPAGWIKAVVQLQHLVPSTAGCSLTNPLCSFEWVAYSNQSVNYNTVTANNVQVGKVWSCLPPGYYRVVSGHAALMAGGLQQTIHAPTNPAAHMTITGNCV